MCTCVKQRESFLRIIYREGNMSFIREQVVKRFKRSKSWSATRKAYLKKYPLCQACGRKKKLEVHHIEDFSNNPELELDHTNLMTLCDRATHCHFVFGHLGNWRSINPEVMRDAAWFLQKVLGRR